MIITKQQFKDAIKASNNFKDLQEALKNGFAIGGTVGMNVVEFNVQVDTKEFEWVWSSIDEYGDVTYRASL